MDQEKQIRVLKSALTEAINFLTRLPHNHRCLTHGYGCGGCGSTCRADPDAICEVCETLKRLRKVRR